VSIRDLIFSVQYGGNTHFQQGAKYSFRRGENTLELPGLWPGFRCVPSMIDSLEVEVLYPA
jgi:hypothetical protein